MGTIANVDISPAGLVRRKSRIITWNKLLGKLLDSIKFLLEMRSSALEIRVWGWRPVRSCLLRMGKSHSSIESALLILLSALIFHMASQVISVQSYRVSSNATQAWKLFPTRQEAIMN